MSSAEVNVLPCGMINGRWFDELEELNTIGIINFVRDRGDADVFLLRWSPYGDADDVMADIQSGNMPDGPLIIIEAGENVPYWLSQEADCVKHGTSAALHEALTIDIDRDPPDE